MKLKLLLSTLLLLLCNHASGYQEFQVYVQATSGRNVNCAMCHAHADGPDGVKPGQIGSLSAAEMSALQHARAAFEPGGNVASPILNGFGNNIVKRLGKRAVLELRSRPDKLAEALGTDSDLDGDGISDADEYLAGTHPLNRHHGDPWKLFKHGFAEQLFHIVMLTIATVLGLWGLNHLLGWFARVADEASDATSEGNR